MENDTRNAQISELNDKLRRTGRGGRTYVTGSVKDLPKEDQNEIVQTIQSFDGFTKDNDPHREHDFGSVSHKGIRYLWKIDYYNVDRSKHSVDPANAMVTNRVLTIMQADEY